MKNLLKLEELVFLGLGLGIFDRTGYSWTWFLLLFLAPNLGMLGYLMNEKIGAWIYNLFHHKGIALSCYGIGVLTGWDILIFSGLLLFAHSSFDRIFGYGLKYEKGFKFTHLGEIGSIQRNSKKLQV